MIGGGNSAVQTANELAGLAAHVDVVVRSDFKADQADVNRLEEKANVTIHRGWEVIALHGDAFLSGFTIRERRTSQEVRLDEDGVFLDIGWLPNTDFLAGFVELNERNEVVVDENCHTSIDGFYAAGDVTSIHSDQIIIAAGEGAKAALEAYAWVVSH